MKKYLILSIILSTILFSRQELIAQTTVSDDFELYSTGALSGQGNWIDVLSGIEVYDNSGDKVVYSNASAVAGVRLNQNFSADQSAKMVFEGSSQPTRFLGPAIRCSGSGATANFYAFVSSSSETYLMKMINGTWTRIGSIGAGLTSGDVMEIRAEGTTLSVLVNNQPFTGNVTRGQTTDTDLTSGTPGIVGYYPGTYTLGDDWEATELNQSASTVVNVDLSGVSEVSTTIISGAIATSQSFTSSTFGFTPDQLPATATMELQNASGGIITTMQFDIAENGNISNVKVNENNTYIPLYEGFYTISRNGTLVITNYECTSVYSEN